MGVQTMRPQRLYTLRRKQEAKKVHRVAYLDIAILMDHAPSASRQKQGYQISQLAVRTSGVCAVAAVAAMPSCALIPAPTNARVARVATSSQANLGCGI